MSQIELARKLTARRGKNVSFCEVSRIENDCANIPQEQWQVLIPALAAVFEADIAWLQKIYDSTPLQTLDTSPAIFIIHIANLGATKLFTYTESSPKKRSVEC